jgi:hypothetical protein
MPAGQGAVRALVRGAEALGPRVAAEFEWMGHPLVFVGARRSEEELGDHAAFEDDVVRIAELDPSDPARALSTLAGGPPAAACHIELGAANAWRSVGPMRLWTDTEGQAAGAVAARLDERPALARCVAPVALEVAFAHPRECWIGVEVSTPSAGAHAVDPADVQALLDRLLAPGS